MYSPGSILCTAAVADFEILVNWIIHVTHTYIQYSTVHIVEHKISLRKPALLPPRKEANDVEGLAKIIVLKILSSDIRCGLRRDR